MIVAIASAADAWAGDMAYDTDRKVLSICGFTEQAPATMARLLAADRSNGWGVVAYDAPTDTYRVKASLYIGSTNDLGTDVQIGRPDHPHETVIVAGDLWVKPPKKSLRRSDGRFAIANRLTLGDERASNIRATLMFDCSKAYEFALVLGSRSASDAGSPGPVLHVFNSTIRPVIPDKAHRIAGTKMMGNNDTAWYASDVRLVNAHILGLGDDGWGGMYGVQADNSVIADSLFEKCGVLFRNGRQFTRNCTFRDCGVVLAEGGCLTATMIDCVFTNNDHNWTIGRKGCMGRGVTLIDCQVGPQKQPLKIQKNDVPLEEAIKRKVMVYPACTDYITLPVKVTDRRGHPVNLAVVSVACPEDKEGVAVRNGYALTDAQGLTPADPDHSAILLARRRVQATDDPIHPKSLAYYYVLTVKAAGCQPYQGLINLGQDVPRPLAIKLEKIRGMGCGGCQRAAKGITR